MLPGSIAPVPSIMPGLVDTRRRRLVELRRSAGEVGACFGSKVGVTIYVNEYMNMVTNYVGYGLLVYHRSL